MKKIVPRKLVSALNEDGTVKSTVLQYQIQEDGVLGSKIYTMGVDGGLNKTVFNTISVDAIFHVEKGEKIK